MSDDKLEFGDDIVRFLFVGDDRGTLNECVWPAYGRCVWSRDSTRSLDVALDVVLSVDADLLEDCSLSLLSLASSRRARW